MTIHIDSDLFLGICISAEANGGIGAGSCWRFENDWRKPIPNCAHGHVIDLDEVADVHSRGLVVPGHWGDLSKKLVRGGLTTGRNDVLVCELGNSSPTGHHASSYKATAEEYFTAIDKKYGLEIVENG